MTVFFIIFFSLLALLSLPLCFRFKRKIKSLDAHQRLYKRVFESQACNRPYWKKDLGNDS